MYRWLAIVLYISIGEHPLPLSMSPACCDHGHVVSVVNGHPTDSPAASGSPLRQLPTVQQQTTNTTQATLETSQQVLHQSSTTCIYTC